MDLRNHPHRVQMRELAARIEARAAGAPNPREFEDITRDRSRFDRATAAYHAETARLEAEYQRLGREWHATIWPALRG